jgi:hypothetical protein
MKEESMITPQHAAKKNDEIYAESLKLAEQYVDKALARNYASGRSVQIDVDEIPLKDYYLREKLIDRYRASGWEVEHRSDQREQTSYYTFSAARRGQFD